MVTLADDLTSRAREPRRPWDWDWFCPPPFAPGGTPFGYIVDLMRSSVSAGQRCYSLFWRASAALMSGMPLRSLSSSSSSTMNSLMSLKERYTDAKRT